MSQEKPSPGPEHSPQAPEVYNRMLEKVYRSVEDFEEKSWPYIKEKIEEAAELEVVAEEMTQEELDLLKAYLKRDLSELGVFMHRTGEGVAAWLKFDLNALEHSFMQALMGVADRTRIEQTELEQRLAHGPEDYISGEIATVGTLRCLQCGTLVTLTETKVLEPCHDCQSHYFHRDNDIWS